MTSRGRLFPRRWFLDLIVVLALPVWCGVMRAQERVALRFDDAQSQGWQSTAQSGNPEQKQLPVSPESKSMREIVQYDPITARQRLKWIFLSPFRPKSLVAGVFSSGIGTASNSPEEYGPHWDGFAKRYGMRFTGVVTSNVIEGGLGAVWGEDPRYIRTSGEPVGYRVKHIFRMTVLAYRRDGHLAPAYARFVAYPGNNFLSNSWRVSSAATTENAFKRTGYAFLGKVIGNAVSEFWPEVKRYVFRVKKPAQSSTTWADDPTLAGGAFLSEE
jgi:hypothetical protein